MITDPVTASEVRMCVREDRFGYMSAETFDTWLAAERAAVWDEACMAMGWAMDNGPVEAAPAYVAGNNRYKAKSL